MAPQKQDNSILNLVAAKEGLALDLEDNITGLIALVTVDPEASKGFDRTAAELALRSKLHRTGNLNAALEVAPADKDNAYYSSALSVLNVLEENSKNAAIAGAAADPKGQPFNEEAIRASYLRKEFDSIVAMEAAMDKFQSPSQAAGTTVPNKAVDQAAVSVNQR